jgi:hypothetical protein
VPCLGNDCEERLLSRFVDVTCPTLLFSVELSALIVHVVLFRIFRDMGWAGDDPCETAY